MLTGGFKRRDQAEAAVMSGAIDVVGLARAACPRTCSAQFVDGQPVARTSLSKIFGYARRRHNCVVYDAVDGSKDSHSVAQALTKQPRKLPK